MAKPLVVGDDGIVPEVAIPVRLTKATLETTFAGLATVTGKYTKPAPGVPRTDLEPAVQTSLQRADLSSLIGVDTDGVPYLMTSAGIGGVGLPLGVRNAAYATRRGQLVGTRVVTSWTFDANAPAYANTVGVAGNNPSLPLLSSVRGGKLTADAVQTNAYFNTITGSDPVTATACEVATRFSGQQLTIHLFFNELADTMCYIDDIPLTTAPLVTTGTGQMFLQLNFADRDEHTVEVSLGRGCGFFQWLFSSDTGNIMAPPPRDKWFLMADSYGTGNYGTAAFPANVFQGSIFNWVKKQLGIELYNLSIGGSGYINPSSGNVPMAYGSPVRRAALAALPSLTGGIVYGGGNDASPANSSQQITDAAAAYYAQIAADRPGLPLIVVGVEPGNIPAFNATELDRANNSIRTAANNAPNVRTFIDQRAAGVGAIAGGLMTGTGYQGAPNGDGNQDNFISNDRTHLTPIGHKHVGYWLADQMLKVVI